MGSSTSTRAESPAAQQVAHFQIRETLGFGALGTVYLAWDTKLNRTVALKVLSNDIKDPNLRQRFHLEARTIAALKHPNIVSVLDFSDEAAPVQFIALERLEGRALFDLIREHGPVPEQVALCIGREVAAALEYAHSQSVVHRDVKPDNVILENERVVLIDFGAIRLTDKHEWIPETDVDKAPMAVGTPGYMAPEQLTGKPVDQRADIFALGALLYNACTARLPYKKASSDPAEIYKEARRGHYRDPRDFQPLLTPRFCDLVAECLSVSPGDRPGSVAKVRERIDALLAAHGITEVKPLLRRYVAAPSLDHEYDLRSVDTLTRELKLALLRDLQRAIRAQQEEQIRDATNRLRYVHHLFAENEKYFLLDAREKPRLLKDRIVRRHRWFLFGFLLATAGVTALGVAMPRLFVTAHEAWARVLPLLGL